MIALERVKLVGSPKEAGIQGTPAGSEFAAMLQYLQTYPIEVGGGRSSLGKVVPSPAGIVVPKAKICRRRVTPDSS